MAEAEVLELRVQGRAIGTTAEHPFFVRGKGWTKARDLRPGDELRLESPGWLPVEAVEFTGRVEPVYNVAVEDDHTYFVGDAEWGWAAWAHNACSPAQLKANYAAGNAAEASARSWLVSKGLKIVGEQVVVHTSKGKRVIDFIVRKGTQKFAIEVKSGNAPLKLSQYLKDMEIAAGKAWQIVDGAKKRFDPVPTIPMYF